MTGQIVPGSAFGDLLTQYASEAETIVELGTGGGEGSTLCLQLGLKPEATLYSVEIDPDAWFTARTRWRNSDNIVFIPGRIVPDSAFEPYSHPGGEAMRPTMGYDFCRDQFTKAANVLDLIPEKISLLVLDAGEWSSSAELDVLIDRTKIVALDDTNPAVAFKNVRNRHLLIERGWQTLHDDLEDRNGCGIWRRPK